MNPSSIQSRKLKSGRDADEAEATDPRPEEMEEAAKSARGWREKSDRAKKKKNPTQPQRSTPRSYVRPRRQMGSLLGWMPSGGEQEKFCRNGKMKLGGKSMGGGAQCRRCDRLTAQQIDRYAESTHDRIRIPQDRLSVAHGVERRASSVEQHRMDGMGWVGEAVAGGNSNATSREGCWATTRRRGWVVIRRRQRRWRKGGCSTEGCPDDGQAGCPHCPVYAYADWMRSPLLSASRPVFRYSDQIMQVRLQSLLPERKIRLPRGGRPGPG